MPLYSTKDADGNTWHFSPLAEAAECSQTAVMALLISFGAQVNETRPWFRLPPNACARTKNAEGLKLLQSHSCNLSLANSAGFTPADFIEADATTNIDGGAMTERQSANVQRHHGFIQQNAGSREERMKLWAPQSNSTMFLSQRRRGPGFY